MIVEELVVAVGRKLEEREFEAELDNLEDGVHLDSKEDEGALKTVTARKKVKVRFELTPRVVSYVEPGIEHGPSCTFEA